MTTPAIEVSDLCKFYGPVAAVDHISFAVQPGELVGFLGLNGAGKTTTLRILTTFMPASSGTARVAGFDVMYQSMEVRLRLGYLPESVPLYGEMRVDEYLVARAKLKQVDRSVRAARIDDCLAKCRIKEVRKRLIGTLSKGYRQRVGLADALLSDPAVMLLDEPLSGLDPVQQQETLNTIKGLSGRHTILFSSHQLSDVEKICDRVVIIHRGKIGFDNQLTAFDAGLMTVTIEVKANVDDAVRAFAGVPGVDRAAAGEAADGWVMVKVESQPSRDVREAVTRKAFEKGWGVRRVERKQERLEDTFMRVAYQRG